MSKYPLLKYWGDWLTEAFTGSWNFYDIGSGLGGMALFLAAKTGMLPQEKYARANDITTWLGIALFAGTLLLRLTLAPHRLHQRALGTIYGLQQERDALRRQFDTTPPPRRPILSLRFDASDPFCISHEAGDELFRVQVINSGNARATNVRVVLAAIEPLHRDLLHKHFSRMHGGGDTFDVSPSSGQPALYVDVLTQRPHAGFGHTQSLRLPNARWLSELRELKLVLRLEAEVDTQPLQLTLAADSDRRLRVAYS